MERHRTLALKRLLSRLGVRLPYELRELKVGGNNRSYALSWNRGQAFLKMYFYHPGDTRDRLGAEYRFSEFAWENGIRVLSKPLARDPIARMGIYEYLEGKPATSKDINANTIQQSIDFLLALNERKSSKAARQLPNASEACFSIADHLQTVDRRVRLLAHLKDKGSPATREAVRFIQKQLAPAWKIVKTRVVKATKMSKQRIGRKLAQEDRCISPSDFGFHNALVSGKTVKFVDFEYAGWDDPAKTVCDFFCQPKIPVPQKYLAQWLHPLMKSVRDSEALEERVRLLFPVIRLKWCCIMLNEFLPVGDRRRRFAQTSVNPEAQKRLQLQKAREFLWPI